MRTWQPAVLLSALLPAAGAPALLTAQAPEFTVALKPDSAYFAPDARTNTYLLIRNGANREATGIRLSWLQADGWEVRPTLRIPGRLPAMTSWATELQLSAGPAARPRTLVFRLDYRQGPHVGVEFTTLRLVPDPFESPGQVADVAIVASLSQLTSRNSGKIYLLVTNKTSAPLEVRRVMGASEFVTVDPATGSTIEPHSAGFIELRAATARRVRPGKYPVLLDITLAWRGLAGSRRGHLVVNREVEVAVPGVSDLLTVFALPSFFLLPGFLMVATFGMLWNWGLFRQGSTAAFGLKKSEPDFWVVSVSLSFLAAMLYARLFQVDYLDRYNSSDVARLWFGSVAAGGAAYMLWHALLLQHVRWKYPPVGAVPLDVLRRLGRMGLSLRLRQVEYLLETQAVTGLLLARDLPKSGKVLVVPAINLSQDGDPDPMEYQRLDELLAASPRPDLKALIKALQSPNVRLEWSLDGLWPQQVDAMTMHPTGEGQLLERKA